MCIRDRWERDYAEELGLRLPFHGFAGSPLVLEDRLVLNLGGTTVALGKDDGALLWRTADHGDASYSNPAVFAHGGVEYLAVFHGEGLGVVELAGGAEVALYPWRPERGGINAATPIAIGDRIFISSAYDMGCALLRFDGTGLEELWANRRMRNKTNGCVLWEGHLYGFDESMLKCIDLDGRERWRRRGLGMGSLSVAGGRLLVLSSRGELIVAEASPEGYAELSRTPVLEGGVSWTAPVLVDGRIYCRNSLGRLVCRDHRAPPAAAGVGGGAPEALPPAAELVGRFRATVDGPGGPRTARLTGWVEMLGAGIRRSPAVLELALPNRWRLQVDLGELGRIERGFDGEVGWELHPHLGDRLAEGAELRELRRSGMLHAFLGAWPDYRSLQTAALTEFGGRRCYAVDAELAGGGARRLYFEEGTGRLAGREAEGEALVVLGDYRDFGGLALPARRTALRPESGAEETLYVEEVVLDAVPGSAFERPRAVRRLLAPPRNLAERNAAAAEDHGELLGTYLARFEGYRDAPFRVVVHRGGLAIEPPGGGRIALREPDHAGRFVFAEDGAAFAAFERDAAGRVTALVLNQSGTPQRLPRSAARVPRPAPTGPVVVPEASARLDAWLDARGGVPPGGLHVEVVREGRVLHAERRGAPAGPRELVAETFASRSMAHQLSALAALILTQRGELAPAQAGRLRSTDPGELLRAATGREPEELWSELLFEPLQVAGDLPHDPARPGESAALLAWDPIVACARMVEPGTAEAAFGELREGFGWAWRPDHLRVAGSLGGRRVHLWRALDEELSVAVLADAPLADAWELAGALARAVP